VLLVDEDQTTLDLLERNLAADDFVVHRAGSAEEALKLLRTTAPDAAVIDAALPGARGLGLVETIRAGHAEDAWTPAMPIVLVSLRPEPHDVVRGLERGADDYLAKPFHYPELLARLGAAIRRSEGTALGDVLRVRELSIDRNARRALVGGRVVALSAKEFALLAELARHPDRVFSKEDLLRDVWGFRSSARTRTVDSHASRLRRKLAGAGARTRYVANIWGVGYRLLPGEA
jgi:DNA-binding response OmpR family regulator